MNDIDQVSIARCFELAEQAQLCGESAVGTVIVAAGHPVAEAVEAIHDGPDPSGHAELIAIRMACAARGSTDLSDCTLYTNVEPCFMCGYAIRATRISRVVIVRPGGEIGSVTSKHAFLDSAEFERWGDPPEIVWADSTES